MNEQHIRDMKPCRRSNWIVHMEIMGNKAWKYRSRTGDRFYTRIIFSSTKPTWPDENFTEITIDEITEGKMIVQDVPNYFESLDESWKLVEKLKREKKYFDIRINTWPDECQVTLLEEYNEWMIRCRTLHEAIVKCALIAHMRGGSKE